MYVDTKDLRTIRWKRAIILSMFAGNFTTGFKWRQMKKRNTASRLTLYTIMNHPFVTGIKIKKKKKFT